MRLIMILALAVCIPQPLLAHGGGLNSEGCHNNRKTGDYHCHRASFESSSNTGNTGRYGARLPSTEGGVFPNCAAARAAGAAPVLRGEPGFGSHLDRDGDGIGCE
jgi:hypothetical protein